MVQGKQKEPVSGSPGVQVYLVDGTYELFRHFFGQPPRPGSDGVEIGAVRGVVSTVVAMLGDGATHIGVATDHVIESFRNGLWPGYKTGSGIDPVLRAQFTPLEEALEALGVRIWPMVDLEADDALASAAAVAGDDDGVGQVVICTPDKDLAQCVVADRVVQLDRRSGTITDEDGVRTKFGVDPASIPDWLALVGDAWPTGNSPDSPAGARRRPPSSWPTTATSPTSPTGSPTGNPGWSGPSGAPAPWPPVWPTSGPRPCSSGIWPPCGSTGPC